MALRSSVILKSDLVAMPCARHALGVSLHTNPPNFHTPAHPPTVLCTIYIPYNTICSLLVPVIRGVFFGVAPPIYTRVCIYPLVPVRRASSQTRPYISPREGKVGDDGSLIIIIIITKSVPQPFEHKELCKSTLSLDSIISCRHRGCRFGEAKAASMSFPDSLPRVYER